MQPESAGQHLPLSDLSRAVRITSCCCSVLSFGECPSFIARFRAAASHHSSPFADHQSLELCVWQGTPKAEFEPDLIRARPSAESEAARKREVRFGRPRNLRQRAKRSTRAIALNFQMRKLRELARLLSNPVLPKANRYWSWADVLVLEPKTNDFRNSFHIRDHEVLTEHALEVFYFLEVLSGPFYEESLIDHYSKIAFLGRLADAADACFREQPNANAHLVCAAVLREAYAMAGQKLALSIVDKENQIEDDSTLCRQRTGYSSLKETIEFFRGRDIQIHGTV
jgi:hypothetical protein